MVGVVDRGETDAAVPHHDGGDAVPRRRLHPLLPRGLPVVVGVDVDDAGDDERAVGVDLAMAATRHPSPLDDDAVAYGDVAGLGGGAGPVDDVAAADHQIELSHATMIPRTAPATGCGGGVADRNETQLIDKTPGMDDLSGKTAVITGAASGIGLALAHRFGAAGMNVVLGDVEDGALHEAVAGLSDAGVEVAGMHCDVSDLDEVRALERFARERFGNVHVLCNNAGVGSGGRSPSPTTSISGSG